MVLVISHNVINCYKKGFMKSLISVFSYVFGMIVSHVLGKFFLSNFIKSSLMSGVEDALIKNFNIAENMEKTLKGFKFFDIPFLGDTIGNNIVKVFLGRIFFVALFFCIFSIFRVLKKYLLKLTKIAKKLPIIGELDGLLGALCGVLKSFIFLFIFAVVCFILIILTKDQLFFLNNNCINSTYLFYLFYKITNFLR